MIDTKKLDKLMKLLDVMDYDPATKTLTIDSDINIKVRGNYALDVDKHMILSTNQKDEDPILKIPYSVFINSEDPRMRETLERFKKFL